MPKIIKNGQCFMALFKIVVQFFSDSMYMYILFNICTGSYIVTTVRVAFHNLKQVCVSE